MTNFIDHTGRHHIQRVDTGQWLVQPIDAWGRVTPEWVDHRDFSFGFSPSAAQDQKNLLAWAPHKIRTTTVTRRRKA